MIQTWGEPGEPGVRSLLFTFRRLAVRRAQGERLVVGRVARVQRKGIESVLPIVRHAMCSFAQRACARSRAATVPGGATAVSDRGLQEIVSVVR